jgi:hypothetical protein
MEVAEFMRLPLHDATLCTITMDWSARSCVLSFTLVHHVGQLPSRGLLTFHGLQSASLPRQEPWGPSNSVNATRCPEVGVFVIELQSGDELWFRASDFAWSAA